jgi:hypothetical protein
MVFERFSKGGMNRQEMLSFLKEHGESTPIFGKVHELASLSIQEVVVYTDLFTHRGEEKEKLSINQALLLYPNHLASSYLKPDIPSSTVRRLQIGDYAFWLFYQSKNDWRSNCGEVDIHLTDFSCSPHPSIHYPLFAIDYVVHHSIYYAIDFNISPQIKGTGIEDLLSPKEIVQLLKESIKKNMEI